MSDKVRIVHPNHPGHVGEVTRGAYERRSKGLGWQLADYADGLQAEIATAPSQDELNAQLDEKDQLRQVLTDRGVTGWDGRTGVKKLRQLTEESNG